MNRLMWQNPATQDNCRLLARRGVTLWGPGVGEQACGEIGAGRMLEPLELRDVITELAEDIYAFKDWAIGEYSDNEELNQRIWRKYPGF